MSDQDGYVPPWGTEPETAHAIGIGDTPVLSPDQIPTGTTTPDQISMGTSSPAPIVVAPGSATPVAPVVVTTKQGVSFSAMILIAAGSALLGGVLMWMFAGAGGLPGFTPPRRNPSKRKEKWGPDDQWVHVPPRKKKKTRRNRK